jgi:Ca2+-binding EF-hand superfamily protein
MHEFPGYWDDEIDHSDHRSLFNAIDLDHDKFVSEEELSWLTHENIGIIMEDRITRDSAAKQAETARILAKHQILKHDKNEDGELSLHELYVHGDDDHELAEDAKKAKHKFKTAAAKPHFQHMDEDNDGTVSEKELQQWHATVPELKDEAEHILRVADSDGDNMLSKEELAKAKLELLADRHTASFMNKYLRWVHHDEL